MVEHADRDAKRPWNLRPAAEFAGDESHAAKFSLNSIEPQSDRPPCPESNQVGRARIYARADGNRSRRLYIASKSRRRTGGAATDRLDFRRPRKIEWLCVARSQEIEAARQ